MGMMAITSRRLGRYELVARIGDGALGEVHVARQLGGRPLVVVKTLHPRLAATADLVPALLETLRAAALVKHPAVIELVDFGEEGGACFVAMEYVAGEPLAAVLKGSSKARLDRWSVAQVIAEAAAGLHAIHDVRGPAGQPLELLHGDVSPGNLFVLHGGGVKLTDVGVARIRATDEGLGRAMSGYLAPELLQGASADRRSDVFSLGMVMWEALTLRPVYVAGNERERLAKARAARVAPPSSVVPDVGKALDDICARALARDPAERFPTAAALAEELVAALRAVGRAGDHQTIARFMRDTFARDIAARDALLREVIGPDALGVSGGRRATTPPYRAGSPSEPPPMGLPPEPTRTSGVFALPEPPPTRTSGVFAMPEPPPTRTSGLVPVVDAAPSRPPPPPARTMMLHRPSAPPPSAPPSPPPRLASPSTPPPFAAGPGAPPPPSAPTLMMVAPPRSPPAPTTPPPTATTAPATPPSPAPTTPPPPAPAAAPAVPLGLLTPVAPDAATPVPPFVLSTLAPVAATAATPVPPVVLSTLAPVAATAATPVPPLAIPALAPAETPSIGEAAVKPAPSSTADDGPVSAAPDRAPIPMIRLAALVAPAAAADAADAAGPASARGNRAMVTSGSFPVAASAPYSPAPFDGEFDDDFDDGDSPGPLPPAQLVTSLPSAPAARRSRALIPIIAGAAAVAAVAVILLTRDHGASARRAGGEPTAPAPREPTGARVATGSATPDRGATAGSGQPAVDLDPGAGAGSATIVDPVGSAIDVAAGSGSGSGSAVDVAAGSGSGSAVEVAAGSGSGSGSAADTPRRPAGPSAASLYKDGQASFMIGNNVTALQLFQAAVHRDPRYAVAYRALGLTYDRLSDRTRAAKAFRTYLRLSPRAKDAALIKARLEKLP